MYGVVEIARGFAVYGDDGKVAVVAAVTEFAGVNYVLDGLGFFDHVGREAVGQVKLADHDLDVDSEVASFAEDFHDAATGLLRGAWPVGDFYVYYYAFEILRVGVDCGFFADHPVDRLLVGARRLHDSRRGRRRYVLGRALHPGRDHDFLGYFFVYGLDVVVAVSVVEDADEGRMGARQGANDSAFGAAIGAYGTDFDQDAVALHGGADGVRSNEDIAGETGLQMGIERSGVGNHEAEAVAMHGQAADKRVAWHQVSGPRFRVSVVSLRRTAGADGRGRPSLHLLQ